MKTFLPFKDFLFELATPLEIHDKYYNSIDKETFLLIVKTDPTTLLDDKGEVRKIGKYSKWMLNLRKKSEKLVKKEDLYKFNEILKSFDKLSRMKVLKEKGLSSNIFDYKSLPELTKEVLKFDDSETKSNRDIEKEIKNDEAKLIYEDDEFLVIIPETHNAACYYGKGTRWCTAAKDDDSMFNEYTEDGPLYIFISKENPEDKYQLHFESGQFMNEYDSEVELTDIPFTNARKVIGQILKERIINNDSVLDNFEYAANSTLIFQDDYLIVKPRGNVFDSFLNYHDLDDYIDGRYMNELLEYVENYEVYGEELYEDLEIEWVDNVRLSENVKELFPDNNITHLHDLLAFQDSDTVQMILKNLWMLNQQLKNSEIFKMTVNYLEGFFNAKIDWSFDSTIMIIKEKENIPDALLYLVGVREMTNFSSFLIDTIKSIDNDYFLNEENINDTLFYILEEELAK